MPATVSVIVPNYNHARFLRQRIDSILAQTFQDFELILLDDCSTDNSPAVLSAYATDARVRLEFNDVNSGSTYKQWNKGVQLARGKYVWIAESDDYADAQLLGRLVTFLERDPGVWFAYCRSRLVDETDSVGAFVDVHLGYEVHRWSSDFCEGGRDACRAFFLSYNPIVNASAVVFRKSAYERIGGADEQLQYCGDWKLWAGMVLEGKVAYTSDPLNYYRFHGETVRSKNSGTVLEMAEVLDVLRWFAGKGLFSEAELKTVRQAQARAWVPALLSGRTCLSAKRMLMQHASPFDPRARRRVFLGLITAARLKLRRIVSTARAVAGGTAS